SLQPFLVPVSQSMTILTFPATIFGSSFSIYDRF
ncbi:hypothetical protein ACUXIS_003620, partial [Cytobacillus horneckiae]